MTRAHYHTITKRGSVSTAVRETQDRARIARLGRSPGVEIRSGPRGTFVRVLGKQTTEESTSSGGAARWA